MAPCGLGHREEGISNVHFYITFNQKQELILKDSSTRGTAVSYDGQAKEEVRHHFTWILEPEKEEGVWEIEVRVRGRYFKVEFASHQSCAAEYNKNVEEFLAGPNDLTFNGLGIYTSTKLPSLSLTPRRSPIYIRERESGRGSFGGVDKVIDVSTGAIYARKSFFELQWGKYKKHGEREKEDWLSQVRKEIRIMKDNQHVSVITLWYRMGPDCSKERHCEGRGCSIQAYSFFRYGVPSFRKPRGLKQHERFLRERSGRPSLPGPRRPWKPTCAWHSTP